MGNFVGITLQLLREVLRQLGDRGLGGVPVTRAVLVEIGCNPGQSPQGVAEDRSRLSRHDAPELHAPVFKSPVSGLGERCRSHVDGTGHASARRELAKVGDLSIQAQGQ